MKMTDPTKNYEDYNNKELFDYEKDSHVIDTVKEPEDKVAYSFSNNGTTKQKIFEAFVVLTFVIGLFMNLGFTVVSFSSLAITDLYKPFYYVSNGLIFLGILVILTLKLIKFKQDTPLLTTIALCLFAYSLYAGPKTYLELYSNYRYYANAITAVSATIGSLFYGLLFIIPDFIYFNRRSELTIPSVGLSFAILGGIAFLTFINLASTIASMSFYSSFKYSASEIGVNYAGFKNATLIMSTIVDFLILGIFTFLLIRKGRASFVLPGISVVKFILSSFRFGLTEVDRSIGYFNGAVEAFLIIRMIIAYLFILGAVGVVIYYLFEDKLKHIFFN